MIGFSAGTIKVTEWVPGGGGGEPDPDPEFTLAPLLAAPIQRVVDGTASEEVTIKDAQFLRTEGGTVYQDQQMRATWIGTPTPPASLVWTSSNEAVATIDAEGFVTHLTTGITTIRATIGLEFVEHVLNLTVEVQPAQDSLQNYVPGSLARHVSDAVDSRLAGKSAATALRLFTSQDHATPAYVRNAGVWCADLGAALCSISPWNSTGANTRAGVAISPLHIIFAYHYPINSGATVRFVLPDNSIVERVMVSKLNHPGIGPAGLYPDLTIGRLDSPLPVGFQFAKVLPNIFQSYLPSLSFEATVPALCLDQEEKALVTDLGRLGMDSPSIFVQLAGFMYPSWVNWAKRAEFHENKIGGDSGNPAFLIINNQLVLLTVWTSGGAGSGTNIVLQKTVLDQMMLQLGGGYTLTDVDLSGFPTY